MTEQRPHLDTVESATTTPDREQPWSDLGLKPDEYTNIKEILGRRPTSSELAMLWCSASQNRWYPNDSVARASATVSCSAEDAGRPDGIGERSSTDNGTLVEWLTW